MAQRLRALLLLQRVWFGFQHPHAGSHSVTAVLWHLRVSSTSSAARHSFGADKNIHEDKTYIHIEEKYTQTSSEHSIGSGWKRTSSSRMYSVAGATLAVVVQWFCCFCYLCILKMQALL